MADGTKERILETALALFAQRGYLGTSMNHIACQLGVPSRVMRKFICRLRLSEVNRQ